MERKYVKTFEEFVNESFHMPDGTPIGVDSNHMPIKVEEKSDSVHEYGCVMLFLNVDEKNWSDLQEKIDDDDVYEEGDEYGREDEPHVTILYGTHEDVEDSDIEDICKTYDTVHLNLSKISIFENEKFDVLKFDVESTQLNGYNEKMKKVPHTSGYPDYHPHCTIAYLKPGTGKKYEQTLKKPITTESNKYIYSKTDGSKLEF